MALADLKQTAERALRIMKIIEDLPAVHQDEVVAMLALMVRMEVQRAMRPAPQQEVSDE